MRRPHRIHRNRSGPAESSAGPFHIYRNLDEAAGMQSRFLRRQFAGPPMTIGFTSSMAGLARPCFLFM
jgi:hypothetical protein